MFVLGTRAGSVGSGNYTQAQTFAFLNETAIQCVYIPDNTTTNDVDAACMIISEPGTVFINAYNPSTSNTTYQFLFELLQSNSTYCGDNSEAGYQSSSSSSETNWFLIGISIAMVAVVAILILAAVGSFIAFKRHQAREHIEYYD